MKIFKRLIVGLGLVVLASGCVYRINIQQGNFLDQAAVEQVKAGMTRSQVRYLLGTPMVADSFNKERWDYIYYLKKGRSSHVDSRRVRCISTATRWRSSTSRRPRRPRRRMRRPPRSRTAGFTSGLSDHGRAGGAAPSASPLLGALSPRDLRIRRQRPVDFDPVPGRQRLVCPRHAAKYADSGFSRSTPAKSGSSAASRSASADAGSPGSRR